MHGVDLLHPAYLLQPASMERRAARDMSATRHVRGPTAVGHGRATAPPASHTDVMSHISADPIISARGFNITLFFRTGYDARKNETFLFKHYRLEAMLEVK